MDRSLKLALFLSLSVLIVVLSTIQIAEYDVWWHLGLGRHIFTTWDINSPDTFSYTISGLRQFNAEWLGDLLIFLSFKAGGMYGAYTLKAALLLLTALFLYLSFRNSSERGSAVAAAAALVLVFFSLRFRLYIRPFLFSYLFVSVFLYIITHFIRNRDMRVLLLLLPVELLWANMSKGAFYGPMLLSIFTAGEFLNRRPSGRLALMTVLTVAVSLVNPEWYRVYTMPFRMAVLDKGFVVGEHQPLSAQILWGYGLKYTWAYQAIVLGSLLYLLLGGFRRLSHVFLFCAFFIPSVMLVRLIDFFSIVSGLLLFKFLESAPLLRFEERSPVLTRSSMAAVIVLLTVSAFYSKTYAFGVGVKENIFPEQGLKLLERYGIEGRVFNSYPFGGYMIWNSPSRKVFIDGRGPQAYTSEFYKGYLEVLNSADAWEEAERLYDFKIAVLEYDLISGNANYPMHLNSNPDWALVHWDDHSAVFLKKVPEHAHVIDAHAYRILKPNMYDFSYLDMYVRHGKAGEILEAIEREIGLNPANQEPRLAKAFLAFNSGQHEVAIEELRAALELKPDLSMEHSSLAVLYYRRGEVDKARAEVEAAIRLDPTDRSAVELKKRMGI